MHFLHAILDYGGSKFRQADLFCTQTPMAITRRFIRGLRGVDNVYAQHVPLVRDILDQLFRGKLKDTSYPTAISKDQTAAMTTTTNYRNNQNQSSQQQQQQMGQIVKPSEVIVFVIGGVTYEESLNVQQMDKQGARIILGGSYVHNFNSFMDEVLAGYTPSSSSSDLSSKRR